MKQPRAWQRTLSGLRLDLPAPSPLDIEIEDIAHGLANVAHSNCRAIGDYAYLVAEHSQFAEVPNSVFKYSHEPRSRLTAQSF